MSESRGFPAELLSFLLFGVLGVAVTAAALACFAQADGGQGCSGSVVPILATTAVCMGSLLCALTAAFRKKGARSADRTAPKYISGSAAGAFCYMERHSR